MPLRRALRHSGTAQMRPSFGGMWCEVTVNQRVDVTDVGHPSVKMCWRQQRCDQEGKQRDQRGCWTDSHSHSFTPSWLAADPGLVESAIGRNPKLATRGVMSTGRSRTPAPLRTASRSGFPASRN
jgi:hypothetical protein